MQFVVGMAVINERKGDGGKRGVNEGHCKSGELDSAVL